MTDKITQTEARRLRRRVEQLERMERDRRRAYASNYPGGVNIAIYTYADSTDFLPAVVHTSRKLGHAVICVVDDRTIRYYAIPHPEQAT